MIYDVNGNEVKYYNNNNLIVESIYDEYNRLVKQFDNYDLNAVIEWIYDEYNNTRQRIIKYSNNIKDITYFVYEQNELKSWERYTEEV